MDLILQVLRDIRLVADTLNFIQDVSVVIRESSKHKQLFKSPFGSKKGLAIERENKEREIRKQGRTEKKIKR